MDLETVMQAADTAMYQAKREKLGGSAFSLFHPGMDAERLTRSALRSRIETALHNNELELWYQPIWSSTQQGFLSVEALLRWPGDTTPIQTVIDTAEESELILRVGDFVIESAFQMLAALPSYANDLLVSVNISPVQFHYQDLVELIEKYSSLNRVDPSRLLIEITERTFIENSELAQSILRRLKAIGVQVAIDDFGTGYSSLNSLHQLDIDWIKIDRAFVTDINTDTQSYQIVNALVKMSEALGIGLIAEGVETQAEREVLERLDVTRQQGYLFARPMPFNKLLAFMVEKSHSPTVAV
jgi:EAL domain-containing protein (putative c-di-GMP-specific phosphodiesterase class I)